MANVTFLGTGLMGSGLAEAALARGETVTVWNRTRTKAEPLARGGARVAASPADAVQGAERMHVILSDDAVVEAVLEACGPALEGPLVVDHSTTLPAATAERSRRLSGRGVAYLHAPVFMSPSMCREAKGMMLAAGPRPLFERAQPALEKMTGKVFYLGERPDLAAAFKLFGNASLIALAAGLADVFAMAKSLDIPAEEALSLFTEKGFNPAGSLAYRGTAMAKGDYRPGFELAMARKDVRLMIESAGGAKLSALPGIAARMDTLIGKGLGDRDVGVLAIDAVPERK